MTTEAKDLNDLKTPNEKGVVPKSRIENVWQAWSVCNELEQQDEGRAKKRARIYKAYNLFPPSEYSKLFEADLEWQSNVPFGMLRYRVNNTMSSFIDMVTERPRTMEIRTKEGNAKEQIVWSDGISDAFEKVLDNWDERLMNVEQCILDMLLYSKGIEIWEDREGCTSTHINSDDLLVPDGTKISMGNFDLCAIKKRYTLHELWEKIDQENGESRWDRNAVLNAIRWQREEWCKMTSEDWMKGMREGNFFLGSHLKEHVDCYILFVREFRKKKVSKFVILRNYANVAERVPVFVSLKRDEKEAMTINEIKKEGFLYHEIDYVDDIRDCLSPFMDNAGGGRWHGIPSLAESVFVQCRQYDFTMNAVMDAVKLNMMLLLQGGTPDATEKLKDMMFGPAVILPSDVPFVQQRVALDTNGAVQTIQFIMLDMFQGIGEYRIQERAKGGEAQTATQSQIDAATTAKLTGSQLKRFAIQEKFYYRNFYRRLVSLKSGERDYEYLEIFKDECKKLGIPEKAWKFENIDSFTTNVLAGAGSPTYKLNAAMKTIEITNISPKSDGQANAMEDALAAYHGRSQVARYFTRVMPDKTFNERLAGYEDALLSVMILNPKDVQVNPDDNDMHHLDIHFTDMERTVDFVNEKIKDGSLTEHLGESAGMKLLNQGGHILAHIENMARDKGKQDAVKAATRRLGVLQGLVDKLAKDMQAFKEQKKQDYNPQSDPEMMKKIAMNQLDIEHQQKMNDMKLNATATKHDQGTKMREDQAAQKIAIQRAEAMNK